MSLLAINVNRGAWLVSVANNNSTYGPSYKQILYRLIFNYIDANEAKAALSEAQASLASATTDVAKAEAQIAVEVAEEIVKACSA